MSNDSTLIELLWPLFDPFQSPTVGNRSASSEAAARRMAVRVIDVVRPYLRQEGGEA